MIEQFSMLKKHPDYFRIWFTTVLTSLFERAYIVIIPVFIYDLTNNEQLVGLGTIIDTLIILLFGVLGGLLVDSFSNKRILVFTNIALFITLVITLIINKLFVSIITFLILTFFFFAISRINSLARHSIILSIFNGGHELKLANAMTSSLFSLALMIGPIIGSNLYVFWGMDGILIFGIFATLVATVFFFGINDDSEADKSPLPVMNGILSIIPMIKNNKLLYGNIIFQAIFLSASAVYTSLIYIFIKDVMESEVIFYSLTITFQGIGNLIGAIFFTYFIRNFSTNKIVFYYPLSIFVLQSSFIIFPNEWLMLICNIFIGIGTQVTVISSSTSFMENCSNENFGRLNGFKNTINSSLSILMVSVSSFVLAYININVILLLNICLTLIAAFIGLKYIKSPVIQTT